MNEEKLIVDPLFKGLTREAMIKGVTFGYFGAEVFAVAIPYILTKNLFLLLWAIPLHLIGVAICAFNPKLFGEIGKFVEYWVRHTATRSLFGGNNYNPFDYEKQ